MPFKSKMQMKKFFAMENRGELKKGTALKWAHETPNIKSLPNRIKKKALGGEIGYKKGGGVRAKLKRYEKSEDKKDKENKNVTKVIKRAGSYLKTNRTSTQAKIAKYMLNGIKPNGQRLANGGGIEEGDDKKKDLTYFAPTDKDVHGSSTKGRKYYDHGDYKNVPTIEHPKGGQRYTYSDVDEHGNITGKQHTGTKEDYNLISNDTVEETTEAGEKTGHKFKVILPHPSFENKKDGGVVKGTGTGTSDSVPAKLKKGSFVVPAIKAKMMKMFGSKAANLNQAGGIPVNVSKGEQILMPSDAKKLDKELKRNGIRGGINSLAPNARKKFNRKSFLKK